MTKPKFKLGRTAATDLCGFGEAGDEVILRCDYSGMYQTHDCPDDAGHFRSWQPVVSAAMRKCRTVAELRELWLRLEPQGHVDGYGGAEWHHAVAHLRFRLEAEEETGDSMTKPKSGLYEQAVAAAGLAVAEGGRYDISLEAAATRFIRSADPHSVAGVNSAGDPVLFEWSFGYSDVPAIVKAAQEILAVSDAQGKE